MRGWITVSFYDVTFAKPCFEFQRAKSTFDFDIEIILTVSQVMFNFTFKLFAFCGNHFDELRKKAEVEDCRLKYVASFKDGEAKVGLQHIAKDHPFYNLDGKDNIVLFYTNRYKDQPLIIKGAGAGAEVTASGIFGDIIRTGNK